MRNLVELVDVASIGLLVLALVNQVDNPSMVISALWLYIIIKNATQLISSRYEK